MVASMRISLFGGFRLAVDDSTAVAISAPRQQLLIACLALHRESPPSRTQLAFKLWPDTTDAQARTNLRNLLFLLRRDYPGLSRFLDLSAQAIGFRQDEAVTVDVDAFEHAVAIANEAETAEDWAAARKALHAAAGMYRGDLMPDHYDEWLDPMRARFRQTYRLVLDRLIRLHEQERAYRAAIEAAELLLQHDPLEEPAYQHLMRLHAVNGDRSSALAVYRRCATMFETELGVAPDAETQALRDRLLQPETAGELHGGLPLIGREKEWSLLRALGHQATTRRPPALLVISGDAGIGKTRLAEELIASTDRQGIGTAVARSYAAEGNLAYGPVVDLLRSPGLRSGWAKLPDLWLSELARLLPELLGDRPDLPAPGPLTEQWQRQRLFEAMSRAVISGNQPVVLLIDDLQWCDNDSLEWIHHLLRFDDSARLLVVGTVRSGDAAARSPLAKLLNSMRRRDQLVSIELGPLGAAETAELAAAVSEQTLLSASMASRLFQETEGNPLFVVETMRAGLPFQTDREQVVESGSREGHRFLPQPIYAAINARLVQLSSEAIDIVRVAAAIGRAFSIPVLARAYGGPEDAFLAGLEELQERRIVRDQGTDTYDFSHDKIREVAYASIGAARRRALHRRVGNALEQEHVHRLDHVSGQLAAHYERSGDLDRAVTYLLRAARTAREIYANDEALALYRRVVGCLDSPPSLPEEVAREALEGLADTLALVGRHDDALAAYERALGTVRPEEALDRARLLRKYAEPWRIQRQTDRALDALNRAEEAVDTIVAGRDAEWWREWVEIQLERMQLYYYAGRKADLKLMVDRVRSRIETLGTPVQRTSFFRSLLQESYLRDGYRGTDAQVKLARAALTASEQTGQTSAIGFAHFGLGFVLWQRQSVQAETELATALAFAEQTGDLTLQARCLTYHSIAARQRGDLDAARSLTVRALTVAKSNNMREYVAAAKANLAWLAWREGKPVEANEAASAARSLWRDEEIFYPFQWLALWPLLAVALAEKNLPVAVHTARALLEKELQQPPAAIAQFLTEAISAGDRDDRDALTTSLQQAIARAKTLGYL